MSLQYFLYEKSEERKRFAEGLQERDRILFLFFFLTYKNSHLSLFLHRFIAWDFHLSLDKHSLGSIANVIIES